MSWLKLKIILSGKLKKNEHDAEMTVVFLNGRFLPLVEMTNSFNVNMGGLVKPEIMD